MQRKVGNLFRLDFGSRPGINIEIKDIFRALNDDERANAIAGFT
jgi:hypothetical protein